MPSPSAKMETVSILAKNSWKTVIKPLPQCAIPQEEVEHPNPLKVEKDSCKNVQENLKLAVRRVGLIPFIVLVLKTTSMYFDLSYYYYYYYYNTNLYEFLLWLNFQRSKTNEALVKFITNIIITASTSHNPSQNIWHKLKKYSKIGQNFKNVISNFACFLTTIANV